jgi:hypothetical protein
MAALQRVGAGAFELYLSEFQDSYNVVCMTNGSLVSLRSDRVFGQMFGRGIDGDDLCSIGSGFGAVAHILKRPVIPSSVNLYINNVDYKNDQAPQQELSHERFHLATLPAQYDRLYINRNPSEMHMHPINQDVSSLDMSLVWSDGRPYATQTSDISIVLAYDGRKPSERKPSEERKRRRT